jgi:hypothetical protein
MPNEIFVVNLIHEWYSIHLVCVIVKIVFLCILVFILSLNLVKILTCFIFGFFFKCQLLVVVVRVFQNLTANTEQRKVEASISWMVNTTHTNTNQHDTWQNPSHHNPHIQYKEMHYNRHLFSWIQMKELRFHFLFLGTCTTKTDSLKHLKHYHVLCT